MLCTVKFENKNRRQKHFKGEQFSFTFIEIELVDRHWYIRMTTFNKAKLKLSDEQTNIDKYSIALIL